MSRIAPRHLVYLIILPLAAASYAGTYDPLLLGVLVGLIILVTEMVLQRRG